MNSTAEDLENSTEHESNHSDIDSDNNSLISSQSSYIPITHVTHLSNHDIDQTSVNKRNTN